MRPMPVIVTDCCTRSHTMAVKNHLKLVKPIDHGDSLLFERRDISRRRITGQATSLRWQAGDCEKQHTNNRIAPLELANISDHGLGAISSEHIELNSPITVVVRPQYSTRSYTMQGRVVRCSHKDNRYNIGIQFDVKTPVSAA